MSTEFITVSDEETGEDDWPNGRHNITTRIEGDLAVKLRQKMGAAPDAEVLIVEKGTEGGYSEYTVEWDWDFDVTLDGQAVWSALGDYQSVDFETPEYGGNALAAFVTWLIS